MKTAKYILIPINIIGLTLAILWWYFIPDFEPAITTLGLTGTLIGQIFISQRAKKKNGIQMTQKSGDNSTNIQVGRDFNSK